MRIYAIAAEVDRLEEDAFTDLLVTGFFGMNFGWLVRRIDSFEAFVVLGVGGVLIPAVATALLLWRAGYLRMPPQ